MNKQRSVLLLCDTGDSLAVTHLLRKAGANGFNLLPQTCRSGNRLSTDNPISGIIHLDSAWYLVNQREQALEELCHLVHLAPRHALHLPASLKSLTVEKQDVLGKDLSMLASCREGDFLIVADSELKTEPLLASLKLWLVPQVPIVFHERNGNKESGGGAEPPPELVKWFR